MSKLLSQILLAVLMFPSAGLIWFVGFDYLDRRTPLTWEQALLRSGYIAAGHAAVYWFLIWRGLVRWTVMRVTSTLGSLVVLAAVVMLIAHPARFDWRSGRMRVIGGIGGGCVLWLIITTLTWRETRRERGERLRAAGAGTVVCPTCGYNLTGLKEARCPECGSQFTLNELMAGQPSRVGVELEK